MDDHERSRYLTLAGVLVATWLGFQGILNFARYGFVGANMGTLAPLLEQDSPDLYRAELLRTIERWDIRDHDIDVTFNSDTHEFHVVTRSMWTFEIPGIWHYRSDFIHRLTVRKKELFADDPLIMGRG